MAGLVLFLAWAGPAVAAERLPNDTFFGEQWYLNKIGLPEAWNHSLGFEGITVAVIDSGIDIDHPDLRDNIWRNLDEVAGNGIDDDGNGYVDDVWGWDFVNGDNDPRPDVAGAFSQLAASHGTVNAGVVAARGDNGIGVTGVTWQSQILAIRALGADGNGNPLDVVRAVEYAVNNGADIINLSFTGSYRNDLLAIALRRAYDAGVLVVAAAGNADDSGIAPDLDRNPLYPVCLDQESQENFILGVAATDEQDKRAEFSAYGAGCVDLSAPGTRLVSTQYYQPGDEQFNVPYGGYYNGTSLAAAEISGVAALLLAMDRNLTPKQVINILTQSAVDIHEQNLEYFGRLGRGRVDAAAAVRLVQQSLISDAAPTAGRLKSDAPLLPAVTGEPMIVAAAGPGRAPELRMFTEDGLFLGSVTAYPEEFRGGVNLTAGDFDGTGKRSLVTGAGPGGGPHVRVFNSAGRVLGGFFAYDRQFRGGVSVAAGDLDGDGRDEIITGAGPGGGPHVRIFEPNSRVIGGFFAFDEGFRGGLSVATGDLDGDGRDEILVSSGQDGSQPTTVRVYSGNGQLLAEYRPFGDHDFFGARVSAKDVDADGWDEIIVESDGYEGPRTAIFNGQGSLASQLIWRAGELRYQAVNSGQSALGRRLVISASVAVGQPLVSLIPAGSTVALQFLAFEPGFRGGLQTVMIE